MGRVRVPAYFAKHGRSSAHFSQSSGRSCSKALCEMACQRERDTRVQPVRFSVSLRAKRSNPRRARGLLRFARNDTAGVRCAV